MSFIEPINKTQFIYDANSEIASISGLIDEEQSKQYLAKFLEHNIAYTMKLLTGADGKGLELYPFQEILLKMLFTKDNVLCVLGRGLGKTTVAIWFIIIYCIMYPKSKIGILSPSFRKCASKDSILLTDHGFEVLNNINTSDNVFANTDFYCVKNKWNNNCEQSVKLKSNRGYSIEGLLDHRILVYEPSNLDFNYKELNCVTNEDILPIKYGMNKWGSHDLLENFNYCKSNKENICKIDTQNFDLYYLIGLITGDGYVDYRPVYRTYNFTVCNADAEINDFLDNYISINFPESRAKSYKKDFNQKCSYRTVNSIKFVKFLYHIGYNSLTGAINKRIPSGVLKCSKKQIAAFLQGLFDSDGCVMWQSSKKNTGCRIKLSTSSIVMAKTLQVLLLNFGIISTIVVRQAENEKIILNQKVRARESYCITISHQENILKFSQEIGFRLSRKQNILNNYLMVNNVSLIGKDIIIPEVGRYIKKKYKKFVRLKDNLSIYSVRKFLQKSGDKINKDDYKKLTYLINSNFFFDTVKEKLYDKCETIDIEVEKEHCYWANGFINHNSRDIYKGILDVAGMKGATLLKQCINSPKQAPDLCYVKIGESEVYGLPLGAQGDKIRGYRFNVVILDEAGFVPERIITSVIIPFLSTNTDPILRQQTKEREDDLIARGLMEEKDRIVYRNNKFLAFSSATYQFEYLYTMYKNYKKAILEPSEDQLASYGIFQMSYEAAPEGLLSKSSTENAKNSLSVAEFTKEYCAQFPSDSDSYFSMKKMEACTAKLGEEPVIEITGSKKQKYLVTIDPNSMSDASTADHFSISVFKLNEEDKTTSLVHQFAACELNITDYIWYFLYILTEFNVVCVSIDRSGSQFINMCNESQMFKDRGIDLGFFEADFDADEKDYIKELNKARREYNLTSKKICYSQYFSNDWKRKANEHLQWCIEYKKIFFASEPDDSKFEQMLNINIGNFDKLRIYSGETTGSDADSRKIDFIDHQKTLMNDVKHQCSLIELKVSSQGTHMFELPSNIRRIRGENQVRRDSYTCLYMGVYMAKKYFDLLSTDEKFNYDSSWRPYIL